MSRDPYEVLGVGKGADIKDVKSAYRKLARKLHPDLHPGDAKAEERFKEVAAAYDFLSDVDKKGQYDRGEIDASGAPTMPRGFYRRRAEGEPGTRYHDPREYFQDIGAEGIFADLFGGGRRGPSMRGGDVRTTLAVDFLDAVQGATREVELPTGRRLKITIPPGSRDGSVLRLKGQGQPGIGGGERGDLHVELSVREHKVFRRDGDDILADVPVTLPEALLGGKIEVPTVDGPVSMAVPKGSNTGTRLRLRGKGAPRAGGGRGDQYVTLQVMLPERPDTDLETLVRDWAQRHPYHVRGEGGS
jgi:DnaJ-class molecular chaperone